MLTAGRRAGTGGELQTEDRSESEGKGTAGDRSAGEDRSEAEMADADGDIPLQSNVSAEEVPSLPSSPTTADADAVLDLPFVTPSCSLALQSKRVWLVRNALVATKRA